MKFGHLEGVPQPLLGGLTIIRVINHLLNGMILQVGGQNAFTNHLFGGGLNIFFLFPLRNDPIWQAYVSIWLKPPTSLGWDDVDGSEIPNNHLGSQKNSENSGISYQLTQLVSLPDFSHQQDDVHVYLGCAIYSWWAVMRVLDDHCPDPKWSEQRVATRQGEGWKHQPDDGLLVLYNIRHQTWTTVVCL